MFNSHIFETTIDAENWTRNNHYFQIIILLISKVIIFVIARKHKTAGRFLVGAFRRKEPAITVAFLRPAD